MIDSEALKEALNNWANRMATSQEWKNAIEALQVLSTHIPAPHKLRVRSSKGMWRAGRAILRKKE